MAVNIGICIIRLYCMYNASYGLLLWTSHVLWSVDLCVLGAYWHHLANTVEWSVHGGDLALCHILSFLWPLVTVTGIVTYSREMTKIDWFQNVFSWSANASATKLCWSRTVLKCWIVSSAWLFSLQPLAVRRLSGSWKIRLPGIQYLTGPSVFSDTRFGWQFHWRTGQVKVRYFIWPFELVPYASIHRL